MTELDYAALAASLEPGSADALQSVSAALGVRLDEPGLEHLKRRCAEAYDRRLGPALAFAVLRRCLDAQAGLAWERLEDRGSFSHVLAVRWEAGPGQHRVTIGIARHFRSRKLEAVWPELAGWKRTLSDNVALATAWARKPAEPDRLSLVVEGRLPAARASLDEEGLLAAIAAEPDDDGPRLVYADWLMERGDARGEFIRLQCEDAREPLSPERTARIEAMLEASWSNFAGELAPWANKRSFSRGLVSSVRMTISAFARHGARVFGRYPLEHLEVANTSFTPAQLAQLAGVPHLGLVSSLGLRQLDPDATRRPLAPLARAKADSLRRLSFSSCGYSAADWTALFGSLDAPRLEEVDFSFNHTHPALLLALARLPRLRRLREHRFKLLTGDAKPSAWRRALEALAQAPLEELVLDQVEHLGDDELSVFFAAQSQTSLTRLELNGARVTDRFLECVARSPRARTLKVLRVENGRFTLGAVRAVLDSNQLPALSHLALVGRPADAPWSSADLEALCAMLVGLPAAHPLQVVGFPAGLDRDDLVQKLMKRFTLVW